MRTYIYLLVIVNLISLSLFGQFTLTKNNMPTRYNKEFRVNDTLPFPASTLANSGASQAWNLSGLQDHFRDTSIYMIPQGTPMATLFPNADLVVYNRVSSNGRPAGYFYLQVTDNYFGILGGYMDNPGAPGTKINPQFKPMDKSLLFPSSYLTSFKDTQMFTTTYKNTSPGLDSIRVKHRTHGGGVFDGYGTTITPADTFKNTLRLKRSYVSVDSIEGHFPNSHTWIFIQETWDTLTTYSWLSEEYRSSVANISYKGSNLRFDYANYLTNLKEATSISMQLKEKNSTKVFPNPTSGQAIMSIPLLADCIKIFDISGKQLNCFKTNKQNAFLLNVENYKSGMYLYEVQDVNGRTMDVGKFSVLK